MNEYILDVLLYLFENFALTDVGATGDVRRDLGNAGFQRDEINDAFDWLRATQAEGETLLAAPSAQTLRLYSASEQRVLDAECRGYLVRLERAGVLSPGNRELVIDRLLALADEEFEDIEI
jgi:Smg protein